MKKELAKKLRLFAFVLSALAVFCASAQVTVTGTVIDGTGDELPGATVQLKGSSTVLTATDVDGKFTLKVPNLKSTLVVSYIGYVKQEVALNGKSTVVVRLVEDAKLLDEVVAIGYGTQKKVTLTGSVSAITSKELMTAPMQNVSNMLTGKIAGLTAVQSSGKPGSDGASLHVRGVNDFSGSGPMVVVDGVPMGMDQINPNDIESVSVLKDASAAIYGVQGANGVILITTKKGNDGAAKISYDGVFSLVNNTAMPEYLNATEYMYWNNKARTMDGLTPRYTADIQQKVLTADPSTPYGQTNWEDEIWRTAFTQQHNISATGGTEKMKYYVSLGMLDQEGTMINTDYRRYNVRSNLDITVAKNLSFTANLQGYRSERLWPGVTLDSQSDFNPSRESHEMLPIFKKTWNGYPVAWQVGGYHINPLASLENTGWHNLYVNYVSANFKLEYDFKDLHDYLKGLKASVWANYYYSHGLTKNFDSYYQQWVVNSNFDEPTLLGKTGFTEGGAYFQGSSWAEGWVFRPQIDYSRKFGKHSVSALYLYEATKNTSGVFQATARKFATTDPIDISLGGEVDATSVSGSHSNTSIVSHVGRLNYDFDNTYLLEFAFRVDGSYKFAPENRWGFFPSVSAGWVMSNEAFIYENLSWIDFLKVRASWGKSGKDNITAYLYNALFQTATNSIVLGNTAVTNYYTNSYLQRNLKWSTTRTYNVGLDFDILKRKVGAEIDVYYQYTNNLLESISGNYPPSLGSYSPSQENSGAIDNRGIDFTLKHQLTVTKDFNYRLRGTFGFARNKVLRMKVTDTYPNRQAVLGQSLYVRYGLVAEGLYKTEEELRNAPAITGTTLYGNTLHLGDIKYKDVNGDGVINYNTDPSQMGDYVRIGYGELPEITFSMNMDFNYKDFYLNMLWQGVTHCDYMLSGRWDNGHVAATPYSWAFFEDGNAPKYLVEDAWTPENPNGRWPRLSTQVTGNNILESTFWMVNGEYLRLKNLTFGYNVPARALRKTPFSRINVYVAGTNVLTFSHFKYMDPETPSVSPGLYPQQATWSLGLNVSF